MTSCPSAGLECTASMISARFGAKLTSEPRLGPQRTVYPKGGRVGKTKIEKFATRGFAKVTLPSVARVYILGDSLGEGGKDDARVESSDDEVAPGSDVI